jgi:hypothetical protein
MKVTHVAIGMLGCSSLLLALGGCAGDRPDVPSGAMQVSSGGRVVAFAAPHDGKAYLRDDTDNRVVYSTDLRRNQTMRFDPALDTVSIDGTTAPEGIVNPNHDHSIYFARSDQPDRMDVSSSSSSNSNGNSTIQVPNGSDVRVQTPPNAQN